MVGIGVGIAFWQVGKRAARKGCSEFGVSEMGMVKEGEYERIQRRYKRQSKVFRYVHSRDVETRDGRRDEWRDEWRDGDLLSVGQLKRPPAAVDVGGVGAGRKKRGKGMGVMGSDGGMRRGDGRNDDYVSSACRRLDIPSAD